MWPFLPLLDLIWICRRLESVPTLSLANIQMSVALQASCKISTIGWPQPSPEGIYFSTTSPREVTFTHLPITPPPEDGAYEEHRLWNQVVYVWPPVGLHPGCVTLHNVPVLSSETEALTIGLQCGLCRMLLTEVKCPQMTDISNTIVDIAPDELCKKKFLFICFCCYIDWGRGEKVRQKKSESKTEQERDRRD